MRKHSRRCLIFLVRPACDDLQGIISQLPLQRLRLAPRPTHPYIALFVNRQDGSARRRRSATSLESRSSRGGGGCILLPIAAGQPDLFPKRPPNLRAGMPSSVIAHVGSGCRIVGPKVLAAVAPTRFVLNASWFTRFNCRFAVLRGYVRLHGGLGRFH